MDDVLAHVLIAVSDEDLGTGDTPAFAVAHRPALERAHIRAGVGLSQVHRACPFARDQLGQVFGFLLWCPVGLDGFDRALA